MIKLRKRGKRYSLWGEYLGVKVQQSTGLTDEDAANKVLLSKLREIEADNPELAKAYQLRELTRNERKSHREYKPVEIGDWSRVQHWKLKDAFHVWSNEARTTGNTARSGRTTLKGIEEWGLPRSKADCDKILSFWRSRSKVTLKPTTCNKYIGTLMAMCNYVQEWEPENGGASGYKTPKFSLIPTDELPDIYLTQAEVDRFLEVVKEKWPEKFSVYICLVYTGARPVELARLKWDDVFFRNDLTSSSLVFKNYKGRARKLRKRSVPVHPLVYNVLNEIPGSQRYGFVFKPRGKDRYTIVAPDGGCTAPTFCQLPFKKAKILSGLPEGTTVYHLRHTFASWLRFKGHQLDTIKRLMGHQTIQTTMRYASLHPDDLASAIQTL